MYQAVAWARAYNDSSQINAFPIPVEVVQEGLPQTLQMKAAGGATVCGDGSDKLDAA